MMTTLAPHLPLDDVEETQSPYERVPAATLRLIGQVFPGDHGLRFVALLLRSAEIKQLSLPNGSNDVAILNIGSITRFAKQHHYSKDTALRYIAVFQALGLLFFHQKQLCFPLGEYQPSAGLLSALDRLIASSRHKQQSLARRVRAKISVYLDQRSPSEETVSSPGQFLLDNLHQLLIEEGLDAASQQRIEQSFTERINTALANGTLQLSLGDRALKGCILPNGLPNQKKETAILGLQERETVEQKGDQLGLEKETALVEKGDRLPQEEGKRETAEQKGDRSFIKVPEKGDRLRQKGDRLSSLLPQVTESIQQKGDRLRQKGDRLPQEEGKRETDQVEKGDRSAQEESKRETEEAQKGDRQAQMVSLEGQKGDREVVANVNVINILRNINVNVSAVARVMCTILGDTPSKQGIYSHLFTKEHCNRPDAVLAALVYTLHLQHRDNSIGKPAAFFLARCRQFHKDGIPSEAAELALKYGQMTCQQIIDAARKPVVQPAASKASGKPAPVPFVLKRAETTPLDRDRMSLTRDDAEALMEEISHHRLVSALNLKLLRNKETDRYALLVDATPKGGRPRQTVIYTRTQWDAQSASMTSWKDLFVEGDMK